MLLTLLSIDLYLRQFTPYAVYAFWIFLLLLATYAALLAESKRGSILPAVLVGNGIALTKILILPFDFQLWDYDAYGETQFAHIIQSSGHWLPTAGFSAAANYYGYFPGIHLILASFSNVSGISLLNIAKYVSIIFFTNLTIILGYLLIRRISDYSPELRKVSVSRAALLYSILFGIIGVYLSRRILGFTVLLFLILVLLEPKLSRGRLVLFLSFSALLAISDHYSVYVGFPLFVLVCLLLPNKVRGSLRYVVLGTLVILSWFTYVAWPVILTRDVRVMTSFLEGLTNLESSHHVFSVQVSVSIVERILPYASQGILLVLGAIGLGFLYQSVRKRETPRTVLALLSILFISYFGLGAFITTSFSFLAFFVSAITGLGLCLLVSLTVTPTPNERSFKKTRLWRNRAIFAILVAAILPGNLFVLVPARYIDSYGNTRSALDDMSMVTPGLWGSAAYLHSHIAQSYTIQSNELVSTVYGYWNVQVEWSSYNRIGSPQNLSRILYRGSMVIYLTDSTTRPSAVFGPFPISTAILNSDLAELRIDVVYSNPSVQEWIRPG
jgi:hypothetical protein